MDSLLSRLVTTTRLSGESARQSRGAITAAEAREGDSGTADSQGAIIALSGVGDKASDFSQTGGRDMPVWDDLLTEDERKVYEVFRQPKTLGTRPAILVIDVNYAFVGRKPEHIVESVQDYRTSCGARGWEGVAHN